MEFKTTRTGGIATVTFCQTDKLNALSIDGMRAVGEEFQKLSADDEVRAIIVTGEGRAFCVGADLSSLLQKIRKEGGEEVSPEAMQTVFDEAVNFMARAIHDCEKPLVAAVNGVAAGGGVGIALSCDVTLAVDTASFNMPFVPGLGIVPDCGSSWLFSRIAGRGRALPALLLGEPISAQKAADWGLIWDVLPAEELLERATKIAQRLAAGPIPTYKDVRDAVDASTQQSFSDQLALEAARNITLATEPNFTEGVSAFLEKRRPNYSAKRA